MWWLLVVFVLLVVPLEEDLVDVASLHDVLVTAPAGATIDGQQHFLQLLLYHSYSTLYGQQHSQAANIERCHSETDNNMHHNIL